MIHGKRLVVVMPAYNAETTVERTFRDIPEGFVDDIVLDEGEPRVLLQGLDVLEPTRDEIVHAVDRVTARQELFAQVRPQHARTTGDDDAHDSSSLNTHRRGAEGPPARIE